MWLACGKRQSEGSRQQTVRDDEEQGSWMNWRVVTSEVDGCLPVAKEEQGSRQCVVLEACVGECVSRSNQKAAGIRQ